MHAGGFVEAVKRHLGNQGDVRVVQRAFSNAGAEFINNCFCQALSVAESAFTVLAAPLEAQKEFIALKGL